MKIYREVWIVNIIDDINQVLDLAITGHIESQDKNAICTLLRSFIQKKLNEICEQLREDQGFSRPKKYVQKK